MTLVHFSAQRKHFMWDWDTLDGFDVSVTRKNVSGCSETCTSVSPCLRAVVQREVNGLHAHLLVCVDAAADPVRHLVEPGNLADVRVE